METERTDRYWRGLTYIVAVYGVTYAVHQVSTLVLGVVDFGPPSSFENPVVTTLVAICLLIVACGSVVSVYLLGRDKLELSDHLSDGYQLYWMVTGLFVFLGVLDLWPSSVSEHPLVTTLLGILMLELACGSVVSVYLISRDKLELSEHVSDVSQLHWMVVALFVFFTGGLYTVGYTIVRYSKVNAANTDTDTAQPP